MKIEKLIKQYPWPKEYPDIPEKDHGWMAQENRINLARLIKNLDNPFVVEIGTWIGKSAKFMLEQREDLELVTIDTFKGSKELVCVPEFKSMIDAGLKQQAIKNLWNYKDRCCIIEALSLTGINYIGELGIDVGLVYIDGSHEFEYVFMDILASLLHFPNAIICGDDAGLFGVCKALCEIEIRKDIQGIFENGSFWSLIR